MIRYNIGDRVGDLTIIQNYKPSKHGDRQYICKCACGKFVLKKATILKQVDSRGYTASCGCRRKYKKMLTKPQL